MISYGRDDWFTIWLLFNNHNLKIVISWSKKKASVQREAILIIPNGKRRALSAQINAE